MLLRVKSFNLKAGKPIAFVHALDAKKMNLHIGERIEIVYKKRRNIAVADIVEGFLDKGELALSQKIIKSLNLHPGNLVDVEPSEKPRSARIIQKRLDKGKYTKPDLKKIISDIVSNNLTEAEIAYFISGINHFGMSLEETKYLTQAIFETGKKISWGNKKIADKHSIGGIPGNLTTPIVVSICAAAGIIMPKTSSRAITSAAGTADAVETVAKVDFTIPELKKVVKKTGACLSWGGSLGLAPADDKLIQVEKILNIDPEPQLLASILAKKLAAGSEYIIIDIPSGDGAKVSISKAKKLKLKFQKLAGKLGLKVRVAITDGSQPIGNGIGPALEMRDVIRVLRRENSPKDLENKSVKLAGELIEMLGKAKKGKGTILAKKILNSGKALEKFEEIIKAQSGSLERIKISKFKQNIKSKKSGKIRKIDNKAISYMARLAGSPLDKSAGLYLYKHNGERVRKGDVILTIYAHSKRKLREARAYFKESKPIIIA